MIRFYYEPLKVMFKIGNTVTFLEYRYVLTKCFIWSINEHFLKYDVLINSDFYLFQNNFASLRGPKWVLYRLKKFLLEALHWLTAPRKYPSVIFCSQG